MVNLIVCGNVVAHDGYGGIGGTASHRCESNVYHVVTQPPPIRPSTGLPFRGGIPSDEAQTIEARLARQTHWFGGGIDAQDVRDVDRR